MIKNALSTPPLNLYALWLATRPWSLPASLVPCVLSVVLVWPQVQATRRAGEAALDAALGSLAVVLVHLAGNLFNTFYDYNTGLDKPRTADDRALVDMKVAPKSVFNAAVVCLAAGAGLCARVGWQVGAWHMGSLPAVAILLAFFYTAGGALALKRLALGDAVVALCFGPLLMHGVATATTLAVSPDALILVASLPVALHTANILHANNARDARADAEAGCVTIAGLLGHARSTALYAANSAAAYLSAAAFVVVVFAPPPGNASAAVRALNAVVECAASATRTDLGFWLGAAAHADLARACAGISGSAELRDARAGFRMVASMALLAATMPSAFALSRRFALGGQHIRTLPQATAQLAATFGGALILALLPRAFVSLV